MGKTGIPISSLSENLEKTLKESHRSMKKRLSSMPAGNLRHSPNYYDGVPDEENLPQVPLGIWLKFHDLVPSSDQTFTADFLTAQWHVHVVVRDRGDEQFGFDPTFGFTVVGRIIPSFLETFDDVSLDSAVDNLEFLSLDHDFRRVASDVDIVEGWRIVLQAEHPMLDWDRNQ